MAPPGIDKSKTMHTAVLEILNAVSGAASKGDKMRPPPIHNKRD